MVGNKSGDLSVGPKGERETSQEIKRCENNVITVGTPLWSQDDTCISVECA